MENFRWTQHPFYYYLWTVKLKTYATHALQILIMYNVHCTSNIHDSNTCTFQTTNMKVQLLFFFRSKLISINNWSSVFCVLLEMPRHNKMSSTTKIKYFGNKLIDFILYYSLFIDRKRDEIEKKSTRLFAHNKLEYSHVSEVESKISANIPTRLENCIYRQQSVVQVCKNGENDIDNIIETEMLFCPRNKMSKWQ